jgi:tetratricopeptide (TPR) repeat protein
LKNPKVVYGGVALVGIFILVGLITRPVEEAKPTVTSTSSIKHVSTKPAKEARKSDPRFNQGFALQKKGKLDEAIGVYRSMLKDQPNHVQVRFNLAHALMTKKDCAAAIPEFERVLKLDPKKSAAHLHLATCARAVGNDSVAQLHQASWDKTRSR